MRPDEAGKEPAEGQEPDEAGKEPAEGQEPDEAGKEPAEGQEPDEAGKEPAESGNLKRKREGTVDIRDIGCPEKRSDMKKTVMKAAAVLMLMFGLLTMGVCAYASDDNSLASLGITTEGATVTPEFAWGVWEYNVTVPAGTTELTLSPITSSSLASIASITGTTLNEDGTGTVTIRVQAGNGDLWDYILHVSGGGPLPQQTQAETPAPQPETPAPQTEAPQTEAQTEDSKYVRVERNTIQEAENTITSLKSDITKYRDTISMYTKIMYGLIAVAVVLLFIVINLILKKKDLKAELNEYRSLGYTNEKNSHAQRAQAVPAAAYPQQDQRPQPGYGQRPGPAQENPHYTNGGQLDVRPQKSQKKNRRLPEYQEDAGQETKAETVKAADGRQAAAGQKEPKAGKAKKMSRKELQEARKAEEVRKIMEEQETANAQTGEGANAGKNSGVTVDMIDL